MCLESCDEFNPQLYLETPCEDFDPGLRTPFMGQFIALQASDISDVMINMIERAICRRLARSYWPGQMKDDECDENG